MIKPLRTSQDDWFSPRGSEHKKRGIIYIGKSENHLEIWLQGFAVGIIFTLAFLWLLGILH